MKSTVLILCLLLFSCTINHNETAIDILTAISIYPEYEKNLKFSLDMQASNWNGSFEKEINGFSESDIQNLKFIVTPREDEKITKIQLRYPVNNKPNHYDEIRKILAEKIEEMKGVYIENDNFISGATNLAEEHLALLDKGEYEEFFGNMSEEVQETLAEDLKLGIIEQREKLYRNGANRNYSFRNIGIIDIADPDQINLVEVHYSISGSNQKEYIVYLLKNGEIVLYGYHI